MKRILCLVLIFMLVGTLLTMTGCAAETTPKNITITLQIGNPNMTVNGEEKPIDDSGTTPVIVNSRTLLPVRAVVEEMGGTVEWNGETREVTLRYGDETIVLTIDSNDAYLNGVKTELDTAPTIMNDRTMLPIRFIAESFHFDVAWDGNTQTVTVTNQPQNSGNENADADIRLTVGDTALTATWEGNASTARLKELLATGDITVFMSDYGSFEKVGALPENLPNSDRNTTTEAGDIVLYQGNQLVIFYGSNTWDYTRLGKITGITQEELKSILGSGDVTAHLSLASPSATPKSKTLTVYFSCTGNTEALADTVIQATGSDSAEIVPKEAYTDDDLAYSDNNSRATREQQRDTDTRPEMEGSIPNLSEYDTVLLGYPIWWGKCPRIILTFLETNREALAGKTVIPFCTSGSSSIGGSLPEIRTALPNSTVKDGFRGTATMTVQEVLNQLAKNGFQQ